MDDVAREHRLTRLEEQQRAGFERIEAGQKAIHIELAGIKAEFRRLNGSVADHSAALAVLQARPQPVTSSTEEAREIVVQHRQMWSWFFVWRWVIVMMLSLLIGLNAVEFWHMLLR